MAWPKGKPRPPTSGRKLGTPNKTSRPTVESILEEQGVDPFIVLSKLASHQEPGIRLQAAKELAQYVGAKRRALEIDANVNMELAKRATEIESLPLEDQLKLLEAETTRIKELLSAK